MAPLHYLKSTNINLKSIDVIRYDYDIGKHGDTAIGEVKVIEAIRNGVVDVGFVSKLMFDRRDVFAIGENELNIDNLIKIPLFDHCQFDIMKNSKLFHTVKDPPFENISSKVNSRTTMIPIINLFQDAILSMDFNVIEEQIVMIKEGIKSKRMLARDKDGIQGYELLIDAIKHEEFYSDSIVPLCVDTISNHPFKSLTIHST